MVRRPRNRRRVATSRPNPTYRRLRRHFASRRPIRRRFAYDDEGYFSVKIEFDTANAAFEDYNEIGRVLAKAADKVQDLVYSDGGTDSLRDSNGNTVGKVVVVPESY